MKILIAEDDNISRRRLEKFLEDLGYKVISCKDGLDAWQIIQSADAPRLLILNWMIPGMDGLELCRKIREQIKEPYTYILLLTSKDRQEDIVEGMEAGADDYITKPFYPHELEVRLRAGRRIVELNEELTKTHILESLGILAGGIAHGFNNNLQAILSNIALAKRCANPKDEIYSRLIEAEKLTLRAKVLPQQLLTFSKGGAPVKKTTSVSELVRDSVNLAMSGSNVRCDFDMPEDIRPVEVDEGQMSQVINKLIINARQAMPEGGIIKIMVENISVKSKDSLPLQDGEYVKITIRDQGTGISQEYLQKIFGPYFTTKDQGSGLGLAIAYSIIKKHDGHICVDSEMGIGTTFYIYLPAAQKEIPEKPVLRETKDEKREETPITDERRILFMEDDGIIRLAVTRQLRNLKYEVETAREGAKAIELYKRAIESSKPYDAVILDLTIVGGMGGKDTIKKLLEIDPNVKAIVASGYSNDPVMANFREYGFKGVVAKPYEIYELDEGLRKVIM